MSKNKIEDMHCKSVHGGWIWWVDLVGGSMAINKVPVTTLVQLVNSRKFSKTRTQTPLSENGSDLDSVNETLSW